MWLIILIALVGIAVYLCNVEFFSQDGRDVIGIHIHFEPLALTKEELTDNNRQRTRVFEKRYSWFLNEMTMVLHYSKTPPLREEIFNVADRMVDSLQSENLLPISEVNSQRLCYKYGGWQDIID